MHESRAFFDSLAPRYDRELGFAGAETRRRGAALLGALGVVPRRVLDLGLGTGRELPLLLDAGHEVVGVEQSAAMIAECNKRARTVRIEQVDFYAPLPWDAATFDAVIALHGTLAHPPYSGALEALVAEAARVARPGAVWFCEVPSLAYLEIAAQLGHRVCGTGFIVRDARSGLELAGEVWSESRWQDVLAPFFELRSVPPPSPWELALCGVRRS